MTHRWSSLEHCLSDARAGSADAQWHLLFTCRKYLMKIANERLQQDIQGKVGPSDIVEETILEARRDFVQFRGESVNEWMHWIRRMLLNNLSNTSRWFRRRESPGPSLEVLTPSGMEWNLQQLSDDEPTPSAILQAVEEKGQMQSALERLPAHYREVLFQRHQYGWTFDQIGRNLGRSADAARRLWSRAIERLQTELTEHRDE